MTSETTGLPLWMQTRMAGRVPSRAIHQVLTTCTRQQRQMSFASTAQAAQLADVNVASIVRAAQFLGFAGWPTLRAELRSRYLSTLSATQVLTEHADPAAGGASGVGESLSIDSVLRDGLLLSELAQVIDSAQVARVAQLIASAATTLVIGSGSFAAPGLQLAHLMQILGQDVRLQRAGGTALLNAVSLLGPSDLLIGFSLWRTPREIGNAIELAAASGVPIVLISDTATPHLPAPPNEVVVVPSEGAGMFPSLVGATALVQALIGEFVALHPQEAAAASDRMEGLWTRFGVYPDHN